MKDQPTIIPATKDKDGYTVEPKSSCCRSRVVFLDPASNRFIFWTGQETLAEKKLYRCSTNLRKSLEAEQ